MRAEWTGVTTTLRTTSEVNDRKYANLFPSVHITYDFAKQNALQLSYSRRVRRPQYNDLNTVRDLQRQPQLLERVTPI